MIKQVIPTFAIVGAFFASAPMYAAAQEPAQQSGGSYNWLHPKLGFVKVNRATGAMVHSRSSVTQSAQVKGRAEPTKYWLNSKGSYRDLTTPATSTPHGAAAETSS